MRGITFAVSPSPGQAFFEQPVLQNLFGKRLLEVAHLTAQVLDLARGRLAGGIPRKPLLAGFQELLRPTIVQTFGDPLPAAQFGDAVLAAQTREHNPDLLLGRILLARLTPDVAYRRLGAVFQTYGFLSHKR